ncbi:hypothetical protein R0J87_23710, partial [Halomonas sp. SIMBA_159]
VFGTNLSKNLCTYAIAQTIKIIGTTVDPYLANVRGNPKNSTGLPALTKAEKFGCNKIPPKIIARYGEHLNLIAAVYAINIG